MSSNLDLYNLPLTGKTILVTRSVGQSSKFASSLATKGANVIEMPAIEIGPPTSWQALDSAIANLSDFDWLILTSTNAVEYFFQRLKTQGKDYTACDDIKIAVVGEKTATCLKQHFREPDFIPPDFVADSLIKHFPEELTKKKILFPRVESGGREVLVKEFTAKNAEVIEVAAYQSCCPNSIPPSASFALENRQVDIITFASSKTVRFFAQLTTQFLTPNFLTDYLNQVSIASIGPQTSSDCRSLFGRVDIEAEEYTIDGLTQAILKWVKNSRN